MEDAVRRLARNRHSQDRPLGEIPRRVEPDRHPQAAGQHVGAAKQQASFDGDGQRRKPGCVRVRPMRQPEQHRGDQQGDPAAAELLHPAKQDSAKEQFFAECRHQRGRDQRHQQVRRAAISGDPVHSDQHRDRGDKAEQQGAGRDPLAESGEGRRGGQIVARPLAQRRNRQLVNRHHDSEHDRHVHGSTSGLTERRDKRADRVAQLGRRNIEQKCEQQRRDRVVHPPSPRRRRHNQIELAHPTPPRPAVSKRNPPPASPERLMRG